VVTAVLMHMLGDLTGRTLLVLPESDAKMLVDLLIKSEPGTTTGFDELSESSLKEAGNILGGAYLNALSDFMNMMLLPSVPSLEIDLAGAVLTSTLLDFGQERIRVLHYTWIAFFMTFYVWFNLAPLATTMRENSDWLTKEHIKVLLIANVALTIPARIVVGALIDRFGARIVFTWLMITMSIPAIVFAFADTFTQMMISRLALSGIEYGSCYDPQQGVFFDCFEAFVFERTPSAGPGPGDWALEAGFEFPTPWFTNVDTSGVAIEHDLLVVSGSGSSNMTSPFRRDPTGGTTRKPRPGTRPWVRPTIFWTGPSRPSAGAPSTMSRC